MKMLLFNANLCMLVMNRGYFLCRYLCMLVVNSVHKIQKKQVSLSYKLDNDTYLK